MAQTLQPSTVCQWIRFQASSAKLGRIFNYHASLQGRGQSTNVTRKNAVKIQGSNPSVDEAAKTSKSQKKREAQRAVRWGMQLAKLSPLHLKRIMRVACLEDEVFDAVMLAKKLGPDGREARRRQFNYIGGLLRKVQPEVMEAVMQASEDGDMEIFHGVPGKVMDTVREEVELEGEEREEEEMDEEVLSQYMEIAKRWSEGLISGDAAITKEVYSIYCIGFDRQKLRKLVRELRTNQDCQKLDETEADETQGQARKALDNFLCRLAQQNSINPS